MSKLLDLTEDARDALRKEINDNPKTREVLEKEHGTHNVFDTEELKKTFHVEGFLAPYVKVIRREDGKDGVLTFQHDPRFYFDFITYY